MKVTYTDAAENINTRPGRKHTRYLKEKVG